MYLKSISINNLRSFRKARVEFSHPGDGTSARTPNVTLLLGNNGAGKTTVLTAIALAVLAPVIESSGFVPYSLVRRRRTSVAKFTEISAVVELHKQDTGFTLPKKARRARLNARIERRGDVERVYAEEPKSDFWEKMYDNNSPAFLVVGYGATRRVESSTTYDSSLRGRTRLLRYQRVAGLFEEHMTLTPLPAWLPELKQANPGRYRQVFNLINRLLPDGTRFTGTLKEGEYVFEHRYSDVPFGALSDGYRSYIGWIADLLYHVCMGCPNNTKLVDNIGVVMVDEIDLHLHPEWQRTVIPRLAKALPKLQFILTTHSPIVVGTLHSENIVLMEAGSQGASIVRRSEEAVFGLNADQILLSSYFGLSSTRAPDAVDELQDLSRQSQTGDVEAVKAFLQRLTQEGVAVKR